MILEQLIAPGRAKYVFRHFPYLGDRAVFAAVVVECAANQGAFWPLHDRFMADDGTLYTEAGLRRQITFEGLNYEQFVTCVSEGQTFPLVNASHDEGLARGVQGTPSVFVNGERVAPTFEAIEAAVNRAAEMAEAEEE